jgi:hypothetical protein
LSISEIAVCIKEIVGIGDSGWQAFDSIAIRLISIDNCDIVSAGEIDRVIAFNIDA